MWFYINVYKEYEGELSINRYILYCMAKNSIDLWQKKMCNQRIVSQSVILSVLST